MSSKIRYKLNPQAKQVEQKCYVLTVLMEPCFAGDWKQPLISEFKFAFNMCWYVGQVVGWQRNSTKHELHNLFWTCFPPLLRMSTADQSCVQQNAEGLEPRVTTRGRDQLLIEKPNGWIVMHVIRGNGQGPSEPMWKPVRLNHTGLCSKLEPGGTSTLAWPKVLDSNEMEALLLDHIALSLKTEREL